MGQEHTYQCDRTGPHRTEIAQTFQRLVKGDRSAIEECIDMYGVWIWQIAVAFADSNDAAEIIACDIFQTVWKNADRTAASPLDDRKLITLIASIELQFGSRAIQKKRPGREMEEGKTAFTQSQETA